MDNYHTRVLCHEMAAMHPEKAQEFCATFGGGLELCRKPDSMFWSSVQAFRRSFTVGIGSTPGKAVVHFGFLPENDIMARESTTLNGAANGVGNSLDDSLIDSSCDFRIVGRCYRFVPTIRVADLSGMIAATNQTYGGDGVNWDTISELRELPWTILANFQDGVHIVTPHTKKTYQYLMGGLLTSTDDTGGAPYTGDALTSFPFQFTWDPDAFIARGDASSFPANRINVTNNDFFDLRGLSGSSAYHLPILGMEMIGYGAMVIEGVVGEAGPLDPGTEFGYIESFVIVESVQRSQSLPATPVWLPNRATTVRGREKQTANGLQWLISQAEGAASWVASNWKGELEIAGISAGALAAAGAAVVAAPEVAGVAATAMGGYVAATAGRMALTYGARTLPGLYRGMGAIF